MYKFIIILTILTSCGTDDTGATNPAGTGPEANNTPPSVVKPSDSNPSTPNALYLNDKTLMPKCSEVNVNQLVYIIAEKQFYTCTGVSWSAVSIKGDKGDTGSTGATGATGATGSAGQNGTVVNGNMWFDPVTLKYWIIPTVAYGAGANGPSYESSLCGSNYHVPTGTELNNAVSRGLNTAASQAGGVKEAWRKSPPSTLFAVQLVDATGNASATTAGYYCMQN